MVSGFLHGSKQQNTRAGASGEEKMLLPAPPLRPPRGPPPTRRWRGRKRRREWGREREAHPEDFSKDDGEGWKGTQAGQSAL